MKSGDTITVVHIRDVGPEGTHGVIASMDGRAYIVDVDGNYIALGFDVQPGEYVLR